MWKPITIKPGDQSLVGREIKTSYRSITTGKETPNELVTLKILHVGKKNILTCSVQPRGFSVMTYCEDTYPINASYFIYEHSPPKKLVAPAIFKMFDIPYRVHQWNEISQRLFESELEAKVTYGASFVAWPAIPNKDGFYEIHDEELPKA